MWDAAGLFDAPGLLAPTSFALPFAPDIRTVKAFGFKGAAAAFGLGAAVAPVAFDFDPAANLDVPAATFEGPAAASPVDLDVVAADLEVAAVGLDVAAIGLDVVAVDFDVVAGGLTAVPIALDFEAAVGLLAAAAAFELPAFAAAGFEPDACRVLGAAGRPPGPRRGRRLVLGRLVMDDWLCIYAVIS